ncbi:MAG TPA: hypothetical protein VKE70_38215 [Candidatus Solibacter sp.]|nr:hypothetical protein [Candidatus Solibacter sp.]
MKALLTSAACIGIALSTGSAPLLAQLHDNSEKQMTCSKSYGGNQARHCEIREVSLPAVGSLNVEASPNGGAVVRGWARAEVLVRAKIEASGENEGDASNLASRVNIEASGGQVRASGPENLRRYGWSVSYEIFTPQTTDLTVKSHNGGIVVSDLRGKLHVETYNGGVDMKRVMGDVVGTTYNGGINIEMAGRFWDGRQMELSTHNGGVSLAVPAQFSARIQAETAQGELRSDFPLPMSPENNRTRRWDFAIGGGGAPIHITTANGGIHLKRTEAQ